MVSYLWNEPFNRFVRDIKVVVLRIRTCLIGQATTAAGSLARRGTTESKQDLICFAAYHGVRYRTSLVSEWRKHVRRGSNTTLPKHMFVLPWRPA